MTTRTEVGNRFGKPLTLDTLGTRLSQRAEDYFGRRQEVAPFSPEDIFQRLLMRGIETRLKGNYGIAAAITFTHEGLHYTMYGENGLVTRGVPTAHAETTALERLGTLLHSDPSEHTARIQQLVDVGQLLVRPTSIEEPLTLWTSLEPCLMCTGASITGGIPHVVIAVEDDGAGTMLNGRFEALVPPVFQWIASQLGMVRSLCQTDNSDAAQYIPPELQSLLHDMFMQTKEPLDKHLAKHPMLGPDQLNVE